MKKLPFEVVMKRVFMRDKPEKNWRIEFGLIPKEIAFRLQAAEARRDDMQPIRP